jgi:MFS family permease
MPWRTTVMSLIALLGGFGLMQTGNTLQGTLLSIRGNIEGFSPIEIGLVGAAFWTGIVAGSLCSETVIERVGHVRTFAALGAIAATAPLFHLLVINPAAWIAARALTGLCFAGMFVVVESWLNGAATPQSRGKVLSVYSMTGLIAGITGQLLFPLADPAGFRPFCISAVIISLALVPVALTRAASPSYLGSEARSSVRDLYTQSPLGVVTAFLCGATTGAFFALGPNFAQRRGLDAGGIAAIMASGTLGGFLMAWPLGWLSDRMDRRIVIICAAVTAASSLAVLSALIPPDAPLPLLCVSVALLGATIVPTYSIVIAHVNDSVTKGRFVAASSCLLLIQGIGAAVGPVLAGFAMAAWEHGLAYTLIAQQALIVAWGFYCLAAEPSSERKGTFLVEPPVPVATTFAVAHEKAE